MSACPVAADVLVIGLGPAGSSAALSARRHGLSVVAIERRRRAGVPVQCAELIPALAAQDSAVVRAATVQAVVRMRTFVEYAAPDVHAAFPGYMLDRALFDQLQIGLAAQAGADCRFGVVATRIATDGEVGTSAGHAIVARVIIAADGPLSTIGRAIGQANHALVYTRQVSASLLATHDATDIFLANRYRGGYGWLFPKGSRANIGVGVVASRRRELKPLLHDLCNDLRASRRIDARLSDMTGGAIAVGGMRRPYAQLGPRLVLLAGDAAGLTNPVTGAGIHAALVSGRLAGAAAASWIDGQLVAGADYAAELTDLFGPALARALARRRQQADAVTASGAASAQLLRDTWIAYPDYWKHAGAAGAREARV